MSHRPAAILSIVALAACSAPQARPADTPAPSAATPASTTTAAMASSADSGWRMLFDGKSLAGWRGFKSETPPTGWTPQEGMLVRTGTGGDIMTVDQFGDFEMELDWQVKEGGNSGIIYRISGEGEHTYESGPEMQVLDDARHADGKNPLTSAGALYGLYAAPRGIVKPAGEWNHARIVLKGNHVEHWLNGQKVVDAELWSPDFRERHGKSKFTAWPPYAKATRGHIALQDHGDWVAYRNVRIRELK